MLSNPKGKKELQTNSKLFCGCQGGIQSCSLAPRKDETLPNETTWHENELKALKKGLKLRL